MTRDPGRDTAQVAPRGSAGERRAYEKPAFLSREAIEVMALACNPTDPIPGKGSTAVCANLTS